MKTDNKITGTKQITYLEVDIEENGITGTYRRYSKDLWHFKMDWEKWSDSCNAEKLESLFQTYIKTGRR